MTLSPQLAAKVQALLPQSGHRDADELLAAALWHWEQERDWTEMERAELNARIEEGVAELDRGEVIDGEAAFAAAQAIIDQRLQR